MFNEICPPNSTQHVVKKGDTLWKLSQAYGASIQSIIDANPGINANNLQIGSTLCIPEVATPPISPHACPSNSFSYIVHSGDTLWKLSQIYGVSVQSILNLNPGVNPQNLQIGSTICIPTASTAPIVPTVPAPLKPAALPTKTAPSTMTVPPVTCPKGSFSYTIQAGDTLWKLSQIYGVSVQSIFDLNPGINPQNLQIGSTICIPTASTAPIVPIVPAPLIPTVPPISPAPMKPTVPPTKAAPMMPTAPSTMKVPPVTCAKGSFSYTI
ncbi:MAG TPA: LysM peptidoglycan-binding domain-containing protein, partial [Ruminiclostridium sp.]|nr:LysM peptidoglycan-binding domain-containing protein [Ruminiclostridium sp.]